MALRLSMQRNHGNNETCINNSNRNGNDVIDETMGSLKMFIKLRTYINLVISH